MEQWFRLQLLLEIMILVWKHLLKRVETILQNITSRFSKAMIWQWKTMLSTKLFFFHLLIQQFFRSTLDTCQVGKIKNFMIFGFSTFLKQLKPPLVLLTIIILSFLDATTWNQWMIMKHLPDRSGVTSSFEITWTLLLKTTNIVTKSQNYSPKTLIKVKSKCQI